jgi:mRNA-degrading endonuclease YafQ of YafQ-DinJ toxin-antitoxin module
MIRLEWSSRFEKSLKKWISKHPESREVIKQKLEQFTNNPSDPELKNH